MASQLQSTTGSLLYIIFIQMFFSLYTQRLVTFSALGGFCPEGFCPTENRRGFCPGGLLSGGFCSGGFCPGEL